MGGRGRDGWWLGRCGVVVDELAAGGVQRGTPLAIVVAPGTGVCLAWDSGRLAVRTADPVSVVREVAGLDPRWTWWSARETAAPLVAAGVRPRTCWDLAAVGRLLHGLRRGDAGAIWAAEHDLPEPPVHRAEPDLLELGGEDGGPLRADGQLSPEWLRGGYAADLDAGRRWAGLALRGPAPPARPAPRARPTPRARARHPALAVLTAYAESAAALLAVELEHDGLPVDRQVAEDLLTAVVGTRPRERRRGGRRARRARDDVVLRHFPERAASTCATRRRSATLLAPGRARRAGHPVVAARAAAGTHPPVAALLAWRKAERIATTYGWRLARPARRPGRAAARELGRGATAAAGRMTASAGLHNLPAELRPAVRAEPGSRARARRPRPGRAAGAGRRVRRRRRWPRPPGDDDMYAPVAAGCGCDRPTAKVAVLAAMYGQTSGAAGEALRGHGPRVPGARWRYLRAADEPGAPARPSGRTAVGWCGCRRCAEPGASRRRRAARGRFARNAVVQGAAAELFKAWAATVRAGLPRAAAQIVLCLHDELLLHVPQEQPRPRPTLLARALDATAGWWAAGSGVRFVADISMGPSWADAH